MKKLLALLGILLICACVSSPYQANISGHAVTFRSNLEHAKQISVQPGETQLKEALLNPEIEKIAIAFVPDKGHNSHYLVTGYELAYKLVLIWKARYGYAPEIQPLQLNSSADVYKYASELTPVIFMQADAEQTCVQVEGSIVFVKGKDMSEANRDYTDLDLAADKLLLVLLGA